MKQGTEDGIFNVTETAVRNSSEIYWCSKRFIFLLSLVPSISHCLKLK